MKPDWVYNMEGLLKDWKANCLLESKAIQNQDWSQIQIIQKSIQEIMATMDRLASKNDVDDATLRQWLTPQMTELLKLQQDNSQNLGAKLERTRGELDQSRSSGKKLNQIKSAYGMSRESVMIHKYT